MRIGLYGMPTAGKTYILDKVDFLEVMSGSVLLRVGASVQDNNLKIILEL